MADVEIYTGEAEQILKEFPDGYFQTCVTSPPYFGLRSYLPGDSDFKKNEIGCEQTPAEYIARLVGVFREVRRTLRDNGSLWLNLGDSYACDGKWGGVTGGKQAYLPDDNLTRVGREKRKTGLRDKNLIGIPWRCAFALQDDGWNLRQWIPWVKPNPMPESVKDRPTTSCETFFLLTKTLDTYYDGDAVRNPPSEALIKQIKEGYNGTATKDFNGNGVQDASATKSRIINGMRRRLEKVGVMPDRYDGLNNPMGGLTREQQRACGSSRRNGDWFFDSIRGMLTDADGGPLALVVAPTGFRGAHFATYPPKLIEPCIRASTRPGDIVLDPFAGSGTTGKVSLELGRSAVLIDLNPDNVSIMKERTNVAPILETPQLEINGNSTHCNEG